MKTIQSKGGAKLRPSGYWRLWLLDAVLASVGVLFFLAAHYGTHEFLGRSFLMALLPFIPIMVLVGGAGSTIFALTKAFIERRGLKKPAALALLMGLGLAVTLLFVALGISRSPLHRLNYICAGNAPASIHNARICGYSCFLREEWLAVFNVGLTNFQTMIAQAKFTPVDEFEFQKMIEQSALTKTKLYKNLPSLNDAVCYKRVFDKNTEHQRGSIFAAFDPGSSTAIVFREYRD